MPAARLGLDVPEEMMREVDRAAADGRSRANFVRRTLVEKLNQIAHEVGRRDREAAEDGDRR